MKPVLLAVMPSPPLRQYSGWTNVWCKPAEDTAATPLEKVIHLPPGELSPLCKGLFACANFPTETAILLWNGSQEISLPFFSSHQIWASLSSPDLGMLYFPTISQFIYCTEEAIRSHNPQNGPLTLHDAWNQALLNGWAEELDLTWGNPLPLAGASQ
ncbi:hypothetical protein [Citrobacter sp. FP75]|uniref:hypothetical protein n=1 Tax=Citrobacter sp. FP75 TaxID=1852949 RepID=UPI001BC9DE32|nr:hypothetical protein [Citrobacter sp. FP75]